MRKHVTTLATALVAVIAMPLTSNAAPFTFLQPGFTQRVWAVYPGFLGGVAFAPDGDVVADACNFDGSPFYRFDRQTTVIVNGTTIHPQVAGSPFPSSLGCGLSNHPNGTLYSNTSSGARQVDANTGAPIAVGGAGGNALGIMANPVAPNDVYYVASNGAILKIDAALAASVVFSNVTLGNFVDGISWDPAGGFLFLANRSPSFRLTILRSDGTLVQHVPMVSEPDGISFNSGQNFVVTNNTDGTMTRFDFPGNDFTQVPVQSLFASGGFRGDLSNVYSDGCIYLTQDGTRYDNGVETAENSIVRICGDFDPVQNVQQTWGRVKAIYR